MAELMTGATDTANAHQGPDVRERGAPRDGQPQFLDRRLFMQLLVLEANGSQDFERRLGESLAENGCNVVVYQDVSHPRGAAVLTWSEDPASFLDRVRPALRSERVGDWRVRSDMTMFGRTYSTGYEPDLAYSLLERPVEAVLNQEWPWAVWYPLRRAGAFERLEPRERGSILREHAEIGKAYGSADFAHDIRLACQGLDTHDNDFVIGLVGKELHPLSHVVQRMRGTQQTSLYLESLGPFFVGKAVFWHRG